MERVGESGARSVSGRVNEQTRSAEATRQVPSPPGDPCASQRGGDFDKRGTRQSHVCKALCAPRRQPRGGAPGAGVCVPVAGLTPVRSEAFRTSRVGVTSCQDREQPPPRVPRAARQLPSLRLPAPWLGVGAPGPCRSAGTGRCRLSVRVASSVVA